MRGMIARNRGFTLIEMMIVVVIVAILAAIAYPAYTNAITKARRSDGVDALLNIQALQEKYRANNPSYGTWLKSEQRRILPIITTPLRSPM